MNANCVSVFVIHKTDLDTRYLVIKRCGKYLPGTWQMVTGGIEKGETAYEAALREVHEETGLTPTELFSADIVETFYMQSADKIIFCPVFVALVESMDVRLSPKEHDAYEWLSVDAAKEKFVWAEQRRAIAHVHENFVLKKPNALLKVTEPSKDFSIRTLTISDLPKIVSRFSFPWSTPEKTTTLWEAYFREQEEGIRTVAIVEKESEIAGYGSLLRKGESPRFAALNIPEVNAIWIHEKHRKLGLGKELVKWIENLAKTEGHSKIGIGVGLYQDYGPAQKLYYKLGYAPDGNGITYKGEPTVPGDSYSLDDDLILWLVKTL